MATPSFRCLVASSNPTKVAAARGGIALLFPDLPAPEVEGRTVVAEDPAQPRGDHQTLGGAQRRLVALGATADPLDLLLAIEAGVDELDGDLFAFAWVVARLGRVVGRARSAAFALPREVADLVRGGLELGEADDRVFGRHDSKSQDGAIGILSGGAIDRTALYVPAVAMALLPFRRGELSWS